MEQAIDLCMNAWIRSQYIGYDIADTADFECWTTSRRYIETNKLLEKTCQVAIVRFQNPVMNQP